MRRLALLIAICALASCGGAALHTSQPVSGVDLSIKYRLVLYHSYEEETNLYMAVLDREDDGFAITPYAIQDTYSIAEGQSPEEAIRRAGLHMGRQGGYDGMDIREIRDKDGAVLGYEVLPIYQPFGSGQAETPLVNYFFSRGEAGVVKFIVRPMTSRKPMLMEQMK